MNQAALHQISALENQDSTNPENLKKFFDLRFATNLTIIKDLFFSLYPEEIHKTSFRKLLQKLPALFKERPEPLKLRDIALLKEGNWYQSEKHVGMQLYVDHFSKNLKGLEDKLGYFEKLGVNFLHLMPVTPRPKGESDGGYAVNSYHKVDKRFGTKKELLRLTKKMRDKNMFLMLDFVANHTSDEFPWAKKAMNGDIKYQGFYHIYPDRTIPDAYEKTLPEIFPLTAPDNFTFNPEMQQWVMTVFNRYQWDLNYSNPEVFIAMLGNLLKLANLGVDVVRLDALAFMWKKIGTLSQNLPEAHRLIALFRMCLQVIAPGVVFLAEAVVAPHEITKYFGLGTMKGNECEIAYNATLMALLWDGIATKKTGLLYKNLKNLPKKPEEATWVNYLRCHDDIGLGFDDRYIHEIGWGAKEHRRFLLDYYCQNIEWSPAKGEVFMYNPKNGDGRITGSCASLLGLEKGLEQKDVALQNQAIDKIIMLHGITLSYGGIPLIYAGDEIGTLNDYSYLDDNSKKEDSRWVNRPRHDWAIVERLDTKKTYHSRIFFALQQLIVVRKQNPVFSDHNNLVLYEAHNPHVFIYERTSDNNDGILVVTNFSDLPQAVAKIALGPYGSISNPKDLISGNTTKFVDDKLVLEPYQLYWLSKA